jgi:hypothetical protein
VHGRRLKSSLAVLVGGATVGALMPGMPAFELATRAPVPRALQVLAVALVVGLVVGRRGWVAAAAAYGIGIALWIGLYLKPSPPWAPSDVWFLATWTSFGLTVLVGVLLFAVVGFAGEWIASAVFSRLTGTQPERESQ